MPCDDSHYKLQSVSLSTKFIVERSAGGPLGRRNNTTQWGNEVNKEDKSHSKDANSQAKEARRTNAEIAFQKMQEKMQKERINQKASMTHKQRVEEFNRHLDSLTEHFDIPKVSWTKIHGKVQALHYAEFLGLPLSLKDSSRNPK
uniref:Protein FAM32A n=1 Tax=Timema tahoe TaxID=61484 RepID=A0A7R9IKU6_9NEOP|nr:unnamed protein product [Timema tahoe]